MAYSNEFVLAFNHCMLYEIGPWFNPNDPGVISGACATKPQQRMVGYVNDPDDHGGLTKYGIAKSAHPEVEIQSLNLSGAMGIYQTDYWFPSKCHMITIPITVFHFDVAVNHGVSRAAKFLQQAVGVTVDGNIGPGTIDAVNKANPETVIKALSTIRADRYYYIVKNDPSQEKFLNGWIRRNSDVTQFSLAQLAH